MRDEVRRELRTWLRCLLIAFVAEVAGFLYEISCDGCVYSLHERRQNYEAPRLRGWFLTFTAASLLIFTFTLGVIFLRLKYRTSLPM